MKYKFIISLVLVLFSQLSFAQKMGVQLINTNAPANAGLRGMSIPNDDVIWVSGSNGTVGKSCDAGKSWRWITVKNYEQKDFRDIQAFDSNTAIIMAIGDPAYILKTKDGGTTWQQVYTKSLPGMFLDAMDFKNNKEGICIGDPVAIGSGGRKFFFVVRTSDGGDTWQEVPLYKMPPTQQSGEGIFSASGTNIALLDHPDFDYAFVTGGTISNMYLMARDGKQSKMMQIPINQGAESAGAFSLATDGKKKFYCIGGDYKIIFSTYDNFYWTTDEGSKWASPRKAPPYGYRSCVRIIDNERLIACGPNGVDIGSIGGHDWNSITKEGFNVCMVSPTKKLIFLAGEKGKIGQLKY